MRATLFVDASYDQSGAAGWGAWIKGDWLKYGITFGGGFTQDMGNSTEAEICGIYNAIRAAFNEHIPPQLDVNKLMIQCDNVRALSMIWGCHQNVTRSFDPKAPRVEYGKGHPKSDLEKLAVQKIRNFIVNSTIWVDVRHVKGHKIGPGRTWVNNKCDQIANEFRFKHKKNKS